MNDLVQRAQQLHELYFYDCGFPFWSITHLGKIANEVMKRAICFYPSRSNKTMIKRLLREREPATIARHTLFDRRKMKQQFGWSRAFYDVYYEQTHQLAPNIFVYTPAFVDEQVHDPPIHILHCIGLAFDHIHQSDYRFYKTKTSWKVDEIRAFYMTLFTRIFRIAHFLRMKTIVFSHIGAGAFAALWPNGPSAFRREIWTPSLQYVLKTEPITHHFQLLSMGKRILHFESIGSFPQCVNRVNRSNTLFLNAWDPLSFIGNGNKCDNSLDGFIGRHTCAAVVGTPLVNPFIQFKTI